MSDVIIRAEGLGKLYQLGSTVETFGNFREAMMAAPRRLFGRKIRTAACTGNGGEHWALRGVGFEIKRGEVVGVIGRNGAGKSTLLKILSQITAPTEGYADIYGRLSSLLEVGTGFHQELTGRENIYLNGSILGMRKAEIDRNFDEIVAFAEVEKFLDTPVKRYSSGMYVRLAFAVAAHLQPEVLVVDEVLAVGDQAFQRKCLGKMRDIGSGGRTVLFVSHNLSAIQSLCTSAMYLEKGALVLMGPTREVVAEYIAREPLEAAVSLRERTDRRGNGIARFTAIRAVNAADDSPVVRTGDSLRIEVEYESDHETTDLYFYVGVDSMYVEWLLLLYARESGLETTVFPPKGKLSVTLDRLPLPAGSYRLRAHLHRAGEQVDCVDDALVLNVAEGDFFGRGETTPLKRSTLLVDQAWRMEEPPPAPASVERERTARA